MEFPTNCHLSQLVGLSHAERCCFGSFVVQIRKVLFFFFFFLFLSFFPYFLFFRIRVSFSFRF